MQVSHLQSKATKRANRVRAKITGTQERPRVSILRSNRFTSAQVIDDVNGVTITSVHSRSLKLDSSPKLTKTQVAAVVGETIAKNLKQKSLSKVVFDRGSYKYHGRVKAVAESMRKAGIVL